MTTDERPAVGRKVQVWINDGPQLVPGWQVAIVTRHVGRATVEVLLPFGETALYAAEGMRLGAERHPEGGR